MRPRRFLSLEPWLCSPSVCYPRAFYAGEPRAENRRGENRVYDDQAKVTVIGGGGVNSVSETIATAIVALGKCARLGEAQLFFFNTKNCTAHKEVVLEAPLNDRSVNIYTLNHFGKRMVYAIPHETPERNAFVRRVSKTRKPQTVPKRREDVISCTRPYHKTRPVE